MLSFIWHLRGSIALDERVSNSDALSGIEQLLAKQRKPVVRCGPDTVAFDAPMWLGPNGPNWLAMVIYDRGRFWIEGEAENRRLRYDLRSLHGMVFCLAGAAMFFAIAQAHGGPLNGVAVSGAAFGWLYGMNLVLALIRIPQAIRRAVRQD